MKNKTILIAVLSLSVVGSIVVTQAQAKKERSSNNKSLIAANPRDTSKVIKKEKKVGNFNSVDVKGGFKVQFTPGQSPKVVVESNQNSINQISVKVSNNSLTVRSPNNFTASHAVVHISAPNLNSLKTAGSVSAKVSQYKGGQLNISSHNNCSVESSGSVQKLFVTCDGKSFLNLDKLRSQDCIATTGGKSFAKVFASKTIKATTTGESVLNVKGNPKILKREVSKTSFFKLVK